MTNLTKEGFGDAEIVLLEKKVAELKEDIAWSKIRLSKLEVKMNE